MIQSAESRAIICYVCSTYMVSSLAKFGEQLECSGSYWQHKSTLANKQRWAIAEGSRGAHRTGGKADEPGLPTEGR